MSVKNKWVSAMLLLIFSLFAVTLGGCPDGETSSVTLTYAVTVADGIQNGSISAAPNASVAAGTTVTLTISPAGGYQLKSGSLSVQQTGGAGVAVNGSGNTWTFAMPASNVTVDGEFELIPPATYAVSIANGIQNGSISAAPNASVAAGTTVTLTISPDSNYHMKSLQQTSGTAVVLSGTGNTRTFTMPNSDVTFTAEFEAIPAGSNIVSVEFEGFYDELIDLSKSTNNDLREGDYLEITVNGDYDYIDQWYLDGDYDYWGNNYSNANHLYVYSSIPIGIHSMAVIVVKNGIPYSKEITFRVVR